MISAIHFAGLGVTAFKSKAAPPEYIQAQGMEMASMWMSGPVLLTFDEGLQLTVLYITTL